jgi:hypothetical protein
MLDARKAAGLVVVSLALTAPAVAQNDTSLNRAGSGARAAGMADAFVAVSDDGTAASWNPAGLGQLRQPELSLVYGATRHDLQLSGIRSPDGHTAFSSQRFRYTDYAPDFASAAVPLTVLGKPVTLQAGWHRLYRLTGLTAGDVQRTPLDPEGEPPLLVSRNRRLDGHIDVLSAAGAVKLTPRLAIGGSFDLWRGAWEERVSLVEDAGAPAAPGFFVSEARVRITGHNASAGFLLTYPAWSLGLVYHAPFWSDYRLNGRAWSSLGSGEILEDRTARFRFPRSIGAGLARRFGPTWTVAASITHDQWTDALIIGAPGADGPINFFDGLPQEISTTRDTVSVNLGAEHLFVRDGSVVPLRLGVGWEPQGSMDRYVADPVSYLLVAAGSGYNTNRFKFDAAVQYRWDAFRMSDSPTLAQAGRIGVEPDAIARASSREWRIKLSAIYRIGDTDKVRSILRKIFG